MKKIFIVPTDLLEEGVIPLDIQGGGTFNEKGEWVKGNTYVKDDLVVRSTVTNKPCYVAMLTVVNKDLEPEKNPTEWMYTWESIVGPEGKQGPVGPEGKAGSQIFTGSVDPT